LEVAQWAKVPAGTTGTGSASFQEDSERMNMQLRKSRSRQRGGFSLAEGLIAVAVLSLFVMACFNSIAVSRVTATKSKERGLTTDFLVHYTEMIRGLPFSDVETGRAINPLLDGSQDSPDIRIPPNDVWVALNTDDFETFHPDLTWIRHRNPKMRVTLTTENRLGEPHTKHLNVRVEWDAPLNRGGRLHQQADLIRVKDL
jgi:hypothetical protein